MCSNDPFSAWLVKVVLSHNYKVMKSLPNVEKKKKTVLTDDSRYLACCALQLLPRPPLSRGCGQSQLFRSRSPGPSLARRWSPAVSVLADVTAIYPPGPRGATLCAAAVTEPCVLASVCTLQPGSVIQASLQTPKTPPQEELIIQEILNAEANALLSR